MEAPDKIYACETDVRGQKEQIWLSYRLSTTDNFEYIRKDALLGWAKRLKERWEEPPMSRHSPGCVFMLERLIDKLNSM